MKRGNVFGTFAFVLVACAFFLWMFFAAATLEHTADLGWISSSPVLDARAVAYDFAARWRHGMAGNSPIYMPGFFAVAIATWFWCAGKSLKRALVEGAVLLGAATLLAALLAPYMAPRIASDFVAQEKLNVSRAASGGTWVSWAQGGYSLITWSTFIIASRWSIQLKSFRPLIVPLVLNLILALVRPWTVADFTSQWLREAVDGRPAAVVSLALVPVLAGLMAWIELRPKLHRRSSAVYPGASSST